MIPNLYHMVSKILRILIWQMGQDEMIL